MNLGGFFDLVHPVSICDTGFTKYTIVVDVVKTMYIERTRIASHGTLHMNICIYIYIYICYIYMYVYREG